jgi:hypothetical protein
MDMFVTVMVTVHLPLLYRQSLWSDPELMLGHLNEKDAGDGHGMFFVYL